MSIDVQASRDAGFKVEYMPSPPPDYPAILYQIYQVLRGCETALANRGMIPEHLREAVYAGCIEGLTQHLHDSLGIEDNPVAVILNAVEIQRQVLGR
jgi:hypothetical protein